MTKLVRKIALVTGASSGIGQAAAERLARGGYTVYGTSRRPAKAGQRSFEMLTLDVTSDASVEAVVSDVLRLEGRIDLLVNNAGYRMRSPLEELPRAEWDAMIGTNLTGVFLFSQAVGRVMIRQKSGKIVNVTSVAARTGVRGMAAYAAAKAGVTVLTQSLGAEWAKYGIIVNAVAPGPVETEGVLQVWKTPAMIAQAAREVPLGRLGRPEEIAWAVIFLASDQASFMTGETLYVSGGPRVGNREDPPTMGV